MVNEQKVFIYTVEMAEHANGAAQYLGSLLGGHVDKKSFIIKSEDGQTASLHRFTWGDYSMEQFNKGQMMKVGKTRFDSIHNKHVWMILAFYWPMTSNTEEIAEKEVPN